MNNKIIFLFSLAILVVIFLSPLTIDVTLAQSQQLLIREMTNEAEAIVVGTVSAKHCEWTADKSRIMTRVTIRVDEFVKGERSGEEITVTHWGGEIGEVGELYTHTPRFDMDVEFAKTGSARNRSLLKQAISLSIYYLFQKPLH